MGGIYSNNIQGYSYFTSLFFNSNHKNNNCYNNYEKEVMTSIRYNNHESIESVEINRYIDIPKPKPGEVLIRVIAISLNPIDVKIIERNISKTIIPLPKTLGCEFSGEVVSINECYTDYLSYGDKVVGMIPFLFTNNGTASEYITINENLVAKVPSNVSIIDVAGIPFVGLTVIEALHEFVTTKTTTKTNSSLISTTGTNISITNNQYPETTYGKKVLIQGASGGIGTFAIQYCKNVLGMYIIATCSENNISFLRSLGVDEVINYNQTR